VREYRNLTSGKFCLCGRAAPAQAEFSRRQVTVPHGLLVGDDATKDIDFEVPADDAWSYRRDILDLSFYKRYFSLRQRTQFEYQ
jgi:hypothetical protein